MTFANIAHRVAVLGYTPGSNFPTLVMQTLETIYNRSVLAAQAIDQWLTNNELSYSDELPEFELP